MNFFEEQDRARRNTTRLVILMTLAVISLIALTSFALIFIYHYFTDFSDTRLDTVGVVFWVSVVVLIVVGCGSLYKHLQLNGGGKVVAEQLGGRMINLDPQGLAERRLLNVVEEMALASGTPVPPVYVLEDAAINAFAAGKTPQDAVIGITRGAIEALNREELQGVIAHEFSHVFHGDMRLNIRLVSVLHGILLIGLIGSVMLRLAGRTRSRDDKGGVAAIAFAGLALLVIGYAGTFFGNLIKAAVSRQREYLADASAVQFTRNPSGIAGALKKIGGHSYGSLLENDNAAQFSHLYFGQGVPVALEGMLATHPPLEQRIRRIEPGWNGEYPVVALAEFSSSSSALDPNLAAMSAGLAAKSKPLSTAEVAHRWDTEFNSFELTLDLDNLERPAQAASDSIAAIGAPQEAHLQQARSLLQHMPVALREAAHDPIAAQALVLGLLLEPNEAARQTQLQHLEGLLTDAVKQALTLLQTDLSRLNPELALPLLELSIPALKTLLEPEQKALRRQLTKLILADNHVSLREWCLLRILDRNLGPQRPLHSRYRLNQVPEHLALLLSAVVHSGQQSVKQAAGAFHAGRQALNMPSLQLLDRSAANLQALDKALRELNQLMPLEKPKLLKALAASITFDGKIDSIEAELMRAIADSLDCPMPPLLVQ